MAITAREMVEALECALAQNVGVVEVRVDGQSVKYDRKQALEELNHWERKLAREKGTRPLNGQIDISGAW